ncbi:MAG: AI-2E family transporter [Oxalobacter formigenes]|nr:AI-2E family transporter [Oxalobacter formigenes]
MNHPRLQEKIFLSLLALITLAFFWLLLPFSGAILWAFILALLFSPLFDRIREKLHGKNTLAALLTLAACLLIAILPLILIGISLLEEGEILCKKILAGEIDFSRLFAEIHASLPEWAAALLETLGLGNIGDIQQKLTASLIEASRFIAGKALFIGQNLFGFAAAFAVMLYLLFFFLRDGRKLAAAIRRAIPLNENRKTALLERFTAVIRAAVKGNLIVALLQGALGGLIFWLINIQAPVLWGAVMAFLSLFPAGAGIIWLPAALYLFFTGAILKGVILFAFCAVVIGLADNLLRPLLVGKDTRMPDYLVLLSTLSGLSLFGLNGFVIGPVIAALFITAWNLFSDASAKKTDTPQT